MISTLAVRSSTIGELLSEAREPVLARPVLMNLLWAGDARADLSAPIGQDTLLSARLRVAA